MKAIFKDSDIKIYVSSMRKVLRVTAIFDNDDDANAHMAKSDNNDAVIAVDEKSGLVFLADVYDKGIKI